MKRRDPLFDLLGFGWSDVASAGKTAFPYIHQAGAGVLSAFGASGLVQPLTSLEERGGLLPQGPPPGAPSPSGGRVPPGAMPMSKPPGKPSPSSAPSSGLKPKSFLARYARPIEIGAGASVAIGLIALLAHAHGKGKRK